MSIGDNVMNSVRNLRLLGQEVELLIGDLENLLNKPGLSPLISFEARDDSCDEDFYRAENSWVRDGFRWTFPARKKTKSPGKKPKIGSLSLMIDLGGEGRPAVTIGAPCVVIAWASKEDSWADTLDGDADFWPVSRADYRIIEQKLFWWTGEEAEEERPLLGCAVDSSWFYIVPLFGLSNRSCIDELIVKPVVRLLDNKDVDYSFANANAVISFDWIDGRPCAL